MTEKIKDYLDQAFGELPQTKKVIDLKDELYTNMSEKYRDQVKRGKSKQEAYEAVVTGMGDVSELVESVRDPYPLSPASPKETRQRALSMALAVGLYIMSPMMLVMFEEFFEWEEIGMLVMFAMIAVATGMIVYGMMTKPKYHKTDDTLVEEFKQWRVSNERKNYAYKAFRSAFWSLIVVIYLGMNFIWGIWGVSWIIFIIATAVDEIIKGYFYLKETDHD